MNYTLRIQLKSLLSQTFTIEAWDQDKGNDDDLLGTAQAGEDGHYHIEFTEEQFNGKREGGPEVYLKVYDGETLIHDTRETIIYSLKNARRLDIILTIPDAENAGGIKKSKVSAIRLKTKLSKLAELPDEERGFVADKLNAYVREELMQRVAGDDAAAREVIAALPINVGEHCDHSIEGLCKELVLPALAKVEGTEATIKRIEATSIRDGKQTIAELAKLDEPIKQHPAFREEARKAKVEQLTVTALGDAKLAATLEERLGDPAKARGPQWQQLIDEGIIDKEQKGKLQRSFSISALTGDNYALVEAINKRDEVTKLEDLAAWGEKEWSAVLKEVKDDTPNDEPKEAYIEKVMTAVERTFPTRFAVERMTVDQKQVKGDLQAVAKHLKVENIFSAKELDLKAVPEADRPALASSALHLRAVAQKYWHLGIRDIYLGEGSVTDKAKRVEEAVASLRTFHTSNPQLNLRGSNLTAKIGSERDTFDWSGVEEALRPAVQKQLQAEQRVAVLAPDNAARVQLMERGFHDAAGISGMSHVRFTRLSGLEQAVADHVFVNAQKRKLKTDLHYQALVTLQHNKRLALTVDNTIPQPKRGFKTKKWGDCPTPEVEDDSLYTQVFNELQDIDGYDALFGDQNFCACDDCKSIFSPSAYFVDLMRFVDEYITLYSREKEEDFCANGAAEHPLYLPNRRPDLWSLPITCENTYEEIPYLQLVNEVKEAFIRKQWGSFAGDVYQELYENFDHHHFFGAPKAAAYDEVDILLEHLGSSRYDIHRETKRGLQQYAYFGMKRFDLYPLRQEIHRYYEQEAPFVEIPVKTLLRLLAISRDQLDELRRVNALNQVANLEVVAREIDPGIQYEEERLVGVTDEWLTRTRRFIQLWHKTGYTILEWELVIDTIFPSEDYYKTNSISSLLDKAYDFHRIQQQLRLSPAELVGVIDQIPTHSLAKVERTNRLTGERYEEAVPGLFARLFSGKEAFRGGADPLRIDAEGNPIVDATLTATGAEEAKEDVLDALSNLLSVINIDLATFLEMLSWEDPSVQSGSALLIQGATASANEYIINDIFFISLLYRHTLLPQRLGLDKQEWHALLKLNASNAKGLTAVAKLVDFWDKWSASPYSFTELWARTQVQGEVVEREELLVLAAPYTRDSFFTPIADFAAALDLQLHTAELLLLNLAASTTNAIDILPTASDDENLTPRFRVRRALELADFAGLNNLSSLTEEGESYNRSIELLNRYLAQEIGRKHEFWAQVSGLPPESSDGYEAFLASPWVTSFFEAVTASPALSDDGYPANLGDFLQLARKWVALLNPLNLSTASLKFIHEHGIHYLKLSGVSLEDLSSLDNLERLVNYAELAHKDPEAVEELLHPMLANIRPRQANVDRFLAYLGLEHYLGCSLATAEAFYEEYYVQSGPYIDYPSGLEVYYRLSKLITLGQQLKLTARQMWLLNKTEYSDYKRLAGLLTQSIRHQSTSEEAFKITCRTLSGKINERRRDILCAYLLSLSELGFNDANELYAYFLIDPQMSGCMTISRIVAAHLTLQLYVQRVQMGLEKSFDGQFQACLDPMVAEQWPWRKNFQVWVANRKVFVYPERYIEPEWRDDKSPEFEAFEEELSQVELSDENIEKSMLNFFNAIDNSSTIQYIGASKESKKTKEEVYHLFGQTSISPKKYYYRTLSVSQLSIDSTSKKSAKEWSPWSELNISINSPYLSPITYRGSLYIFWISIVSNPQTKMVNGTSSSNYVDHRISLHYSKLTSSKTWLNPQDVEGFWGNAGDDFNPEKGAGEFDDLDRFNSSRNKNRVYPYIKDNRIHLDYLRRNTYLGSFIFDHTRNEVNGLSEDFNSPWETTNKITPTELILMRFNKDLVRFFEVGSSYSSFFAQAEDYTFHDSTINFYSDAIDPVNYTRGDQLTSDYYLNGESLDTRIVLNTASDQLIRVGKTQLLTRLTSLNELLPQPPSSNSQAVVWIQSKKESILLSTSVIESLREILANGDVSALLDLETQYITEVTDEFEFRDTSLLSSPIAPRDSIDFFGPLGGHFKELFFHSSFTLASQLNSTGEFSSAQKWFHYIFSPLTGDKHNTTVNENWKYLPFSYNNDFIYSAVLSNPGAIHDYEVDPFNPHVIARLRPLSYQKVIVRKYIENLLDWGDSLFRKFQFETINEAMMLYILAQDILGERPQELGKCNIASNEAFTFDDVHRSIFDEQNNKYTAGTDFLVVLENKAIDWRIGANGELVFINGSESIEVAVNYDTSAVGGEDEIVINVTPEIRSGTFLMPDGRQLFCVPMDKEVLALWDKVEDRLYKIRHCLNIDGVKQKLSLFAPAIDPRALVAARAAGLSIEDAIASLDVAIPYYRFHYMIEKARAFNGTVQGFGSALLSALEKKDAEELTLLRSVHEQNILGLTTGIKTKQIEESKLQLANLLENKTNIQNRVDYYTELETTGLLEEEKKEQSFRKQGSELRAAANILSNSASIAALIPDIGSPFALKFGGGQISGNLKYYSNAVGILATIKETLSANQSIKASNKRREQEWKHQLKLAEQELKSLDQQIAAAQIRLSIAEQDLKIHTQQTEQSKELYDFYKEKFSNLGLYKYMATELQRLCSRSYNLAFDMAQQAQRCYTFETGHQAPNFIKPDNWDTGHAGLLAGERLAFQLNQMEKAFIESNPRREEVRQSISLRMIDPTAFLVFRKTGECTFSIPEEVFDLPYPGHFKRMLRTASITIPCVVGPYTNVPVRFTLLKSELRTKPIYDEKKPKEGLTQGPAFANGGLSASSAVNDAGQLELDFRDAKYLPFEGGGAISKWSLQLPSSVRPFDYNTISDVILNLSYTAEYDSVLRASVESDLAGKIPNVFTRLVSIREEFPDVWYKLEQGEDETFELPENLAPYFMPSKSPRSVSCFKMDSPSWQEVSNSNIVSLTEGMIVNLAQDGELKDILLKIEY